MPSYKYPRVLEKIQLDSWVLWEELVAAERTLRERGCDQIRLDADGSEWDWAGTRVHLEGWRDMTDSERAEFREKEKLNKLRRDLIRLQRELEGLKAARDALRQKDRLYGELEEQIAERQSEIAGVEQSIVYQTDKLAEASKKALESAPQTCH